MRSTIKVLVVDDSALVRQMVSRALSSLDDIEVVGIARTGVEALERIGEVHPDVVTLDIEMPELSGIEALPHIIKNSTARVVMLSVLDDADTTYQALALGASEFVGKPKSGIATSMPELTAELATAIRAAYRVRPERRLAQRPPHPRGGPPTPRAGTIEHVIALTASTGGPPALEAVFTTLPASFPAAYLIVQHLPPGFSESLARRLTRAGEIPCIEAAPDMVVEPGTAYLAPHGLHMRLEAEGQGYRLVMQGGTRLHGVRPAGDPLLESVAQHAGPRSVGVVLSGMGVDGARGLAAISAAGGRAIIQDEATSAVWGMPGTAARRVPSALAVPISGVAGAILDSKSGVIRP